MVHRRRDGRLVHDRVEDGPEDGGARCRPPERRNLGAGNRWGRCRFAVLPRRGHAQAAHAMAGEEEILRDIGSCLTIDGKSLPGIWLTKRALSQSAKRAKKYGTSTVLIKNSHHNGALAAYMLPIINQNLVPIIKSSVPSSATVAPFGGTKALLTPDPMALGYPTNKEPVIIDISASITTNNMIADKIAKNKLFDFDCLLTSEGIPTNDPKEVMEKINTKIINMYW